MSNPSQRRHPIFALLGFFILVYTVAYVGSLAVLPALEFWYITLKKPSWNPPTYVFGPVWTVLYGLMGWAAWTVWRTPSGEQPSGRRTAALVTFFAQLTLNCLWSWIFFGWRQIGPAFYEIGVLWLAIVATLILFWRIRPAAGAVLLPYLAWTTFASALNFAIWRLNS